jgi:hypothetical protein
MYSYTQARLASFFQIPQGHKVRGKKNKKKKGLLC